MRSRKTVKLKIHYGGSMQTSNGDYRYLSEIGCKSVVWKACDVKLEKIQKFIKDERCNTAINFLWYKRANAETKSMDYVCPGGNAFGDLEEIVLCGGLGGEVDVYIEHLGAEHIPSESLCLPSSQREDLDDIDGNDGDNEREDEIVAEKKRYEFGDGSHGGVNQDDNEDEDEEDVGVDRPREDNEPEESEDERHPDDDVDGEELHRQIEEGNYNVVDDDDDDGEDVVLDAGDGGDDERFKSLFEEATKTRVDTVKAYKEDSEDEDSDPEFGLGDDLYPDTPLESEEEWEQWDRYPRKMKKKNQFHGDLLKEPYLWLFQKFNSGLEFKDQLLRYALNTQYDVKMAKSEANRIAVVCCKEKCSWRVFCSVEKPINKWMVKVCHNVHNHSKTSRVSMVKQGVIAGLFREELRRNVTLEANHMKDAIKERYNIVVPISKCYRGRRIALNTILEAQAIQFAKLWDYEAELKRSNPGVTTELNTEQVNGVDIFASFYICFEPLRKAWLNSCRPVIGLDGCFLKWELKGDLLAAVGRDADNKMYPIAWAVVKGETTDSWTWFVKKLKDDLNLGTGDNLTIISDKAKGLLNAIADVFPGAEHRMCARHIYANWKKTFSRSEYKNFFWTVAYSYNIGEYEESMDLLKAYDPAAEAALILKEPEKWCRAFFTTDSHCSDVHNNLSEAFNRTIKAARTKPVISMLEDIRRQAMNRISRRFLKAEKCNTYLTPITMALLEKARVDNKYCKTNRSGSTLYEVTEFDCGYSVSLSTHECACRRWDLTGIPCKHAVCVLDDNNVDPVTYTSLYYCASRLKKTYDDNIKPVNGEKFWRKTYKTPIAIPEIRKRRGRKKNRDRKKEPFEDLKNKGKATRHGRIPHCSNCLQAGHIKSGCRNEKVVIEGPKNRRGRPYKVEDEGIPKHPKQPRKKRKPNSESSTQPAQLAEPTEVAEGSSSYPASSSAPQPATSSTTPKPHVKKPPRKKALKVTKGINVENIPRHIEVYWSPYTDRPFEVNPQNPSAVGNSSQPPQVGSQPPQASSQPPQASSQPPQAGSQPLE